MNYLELISNDEDINNESYKKEELNSLKVLNISISLTNFEECELKDSIYENVHFDKVNFNNCDLSNTKFIECSFHSCNINNSKILGTMFNNCRITKLNINNSVCKYINLVDLKTKELTIKDSDLTESSLFNIELNKTPFLT